MGSSLGFLGNPLEACSGHAPRLARDGLALAAFAARPSVVSTTSAPLRNDGYFGADPRGPLPRCLRFAPPVGPARTQDSLPACLARALAGLDFHQLDSTERFHLPMIKLPLSQALPDAMRHPLIL